MKLPSHHRSAVTATLLVLLAACQDQPLIPEAPTDASAPEKPVAAALEPGDYTCLTSVATPKGPAPYRYGFIKLEFPNEVRHPREATHRYRYRAVDAAGNVVRVVNCTLPRSDAAVAMMHRRLGVTPSRETGATRLDMQPSGCVSDGLCVLPPIVVDGCDPYQELDFSCEEGGVCMTEVFYSDGSGQTIQGCEGGGGGGGGSGSGGYPPDPGDPYTWDDGTGRDPCTRDAAGHCILRDLSTEEWTRFAARVEEISEATPECAGAKNALRGLIAQGPAARRIRFWDGYDKISASEQRFGENLSDAQGRYIKFDSHWVWDRGDMRALIVHEGLHLYLHQTNSPLLGEANELWVDATAPTCV